MFDLVKADAKITVLYTYLLRATEEVKTELRMFLLLL